MTENNCFICSGELSYTEQVALMRCEYCGDKFESSVACVNDHYICDGCHSSAGNDFIERYCIKSQEIDPVAMATQIMSHPSIKMHGPEHHYLVGAVLISAYYNITGLPERKMEKLATAKKRAGHVLGGFCGFYGTCGAAMSSGIFMSLVTGTTPLSEESWGLCILLTSRALKTIGETGGPRCCKRDSYHAITEAIPFVKENLDVELASLSHISCIFHESNKECITDRCPYYPKI